jgi:hypothetical protein
MFLDQLLEELRVGLSGNPQIGRTAAVHGQDLLARGFTLSEVVHHYGDVCQVVTEMATEKEAPIRPDDFRMLNRCLDDAIAAAVTEYGHLRDKTETNAALRDGRRLQEMADRMRGSVMAARASYQAIKDGQVGHAGSTGKVLDRSLESLEELVDSLRAELATAKRAARERQAGGNW